MTDLSIRLRLSTSEAREKISQIVTAVQNPQSYCVLTRHNKPMAAIVSMEDLRRIWKDQEVDDVSSGKRDPAYFYFGKGGYATNLEAATAIRAVQLDRRMEREVLKAAGKAPVPGGELTVERVEAVARPWWRFWDRRARRARVGSGAVMAAGLLEAVIGAKGGRQ